MAITKRQGNFHHIAWLELSGNGVLTECAIVKEDSFGNIYYIDLTMLDDIDKRRLVKIVTNRNAGNYPLWDMMSQVTLNNGINALDYFHQLVKVITPEGVIMNPRAGVVGTGKVNTKSDSEMKSIELTASMENVSSDDLTPAQKRAATLAKKKSE